jgi:hypothetical protein
MANNDLRAGRRASPWRPPDPESRNRERAQFFKVGALIEFDFCNEQFTVIAVVEKALRLAPKLSGAMVYRLSYSRDR